MNGPTRHRTPTGYWTTVFLLLGAARRRATGRQKRQQELMRQRTKKSSSFQWEGLAIFAGMMFAVVISGMAAYLVYGAVEAGQKLAVERSGKIVVDEWFKRRVDTALAAAPERHSAPKQDDALDLLYGRKPANQSPPPTQKKIIGTPAAKRREPSAQDKFGTLESDYKEEARQLARHDGDTARDIEGKLRAAVLSHGSADLATSEDAGSASTALSDGHSLAALLGSLVLLWWMLMMVFQGEGLELDLQRRRHPMWEWLFTHPVPAGAIFTAEMLSPIAANPIYWGAPLFAGVLYGYTYNFGVGVLAALAVGVPVAVAAACLGKALEIGITIRFSPRSRGALLGLMSWLGYVSLILMMVSARSVSTVGAALGRFLAPLMAVPWPYLGLFLGLRQGAEPSFVSGVLTCWVAAVFVTALAVRFCVWGANQGLSGNTGDAVVARASGSRGARFGREPLYRKEFLWFVRDRGAIVQTILIPLSVAGFQVFNLHGALQTAQTSWNYLCGTAILFGTYFLWVLGPKSLASEGPALWLSLTWPRGLENLLKAKAWLWSMISAGVVTLILAYTVFLFPAEVWKVTLVGVGWLIFGRSMAEKTVTLVTVASSSGDAEPIPRSRRWAASLGMLTFAIGVMTQQWHVAIMGIVYSYITAAAMWENFRARLPFLYDPWSEKLPPAPTLMHAMIAISILVELGAVVTAPVYALAGHTYVGLVSSVLYAGCALGVTVGVGRFLKKRGVGLRDVWYWRPDSARAAGWNFLAAPLAGIAGGIMLGLLARGYTDVLLHVPSLAEIVHRSRDLLAKSPGLKLYYAVVAVGVAPFAEEYLFRGLLFRALDREWGGWRAVVGSAAFFAVYHPPLAWLPVGLLGVANAVLFKATGRLTPAVILHMVYNAVIVLT